MIKTCFTCDKGYCRYIDTNKPDYKKVFDCRNHNYIFWKQKNK